MDQLPMDQPPSSQRPLLPFPFQLTPIIALFWVMWSILSTATCMEKHGFDTLTLNPPPIPFSTRPSRSQTDSHTTVANGEGLNRNPSPIQQRSFAVSPSPTAAGWNSSSPASPSRHSRSGRYQYYAVTVGKRTGVFADWYVQRDLCMISLSVISGATSAVLLKEYLWPVRRDFVPIERR